MNFINELKRRNVFRMGIAYVVVAWVVLQGIDFALDIISAPNWVMQVFLIAGIAGLPIVLIIAWIFELTPEGIKLESQIDRSQSVTSDTAQKMDKTIIVFLALAVAILVADRFLNDERPSSTAMPTAVELADSDREAGNLSGSSVAVLPFVNMSSDPEQEYFSDGISEEILNVLTRIPNLKVAARTSSFQFKGKNLDIADIGQRLQVNHLLEGSVRKSGDTLRITAQLIETDTGFHLWSETYDRKLEDVFAIQDEIAAAIATQLRTMLATQIVTVSTPVDMKAYDLYLRGRGLVATRKQAGIVEGINYLEQALEIEPEYPAAMATLAKAYVVLPFFSTAPARKLREQARELALKAIAIDENNVEALSVLGMVYSELDIDPGKSIELLERAVKLNPGSVVANNFLGDVYLRIADLDNALKYELRAAELDPLGSVQLSDLATISLIKGDYESVMSLTDRALALDSTFLHALMYQAQTHYFRGDVAPLKHAVQMIKSIPGIEPGRLASAQGLLILAEGNRQLSENILEKNIQLANDNKMSFIHIARQAILLDKFDIAGNMLLKALQEKDGRWTYPLFIRLPEQAPDSEPWQEFWRQPGPKRLAELRRSNGFTPHAPTFGSGAKK